MYNLFISCAIKGKEWLCLNCQVKRAAGGIEPQKGTSLVNSSLKKPNTGQPAAQKTSAPGSPQRTVSAPAAKPLNAAAAKEPDTQIQASPALSKKTPQGSQKTVPQKQPDQTNVAAQKLRDANAVTQQQSPVQTRQTERKQSNATASTQQESGGFFGFGGPKSQTDAAKPAESVTGKMFGFGSSIFSSASTLISTAVQDEPKSTPPVSPNMPAAKDSKFPEKKPEQGQPQQGKGLPSSQPKADKPLSEPSKKASPAVSKSSESTCPLCKLELHVGSKDPPNYNTCTECKNIVCNQCGFNPMPNVKEVR